jgi:hypothetical protein
MDNEDLLRLQEQERSEVERILLDSAADMREFVAIRKNFRKQVLHPEAPLDQLTPADYCRIKNREIDPWTKRRR